MEDAELVIIGGGPAGMAAAHSASEAGLEHIIVLERNAELGGILPQCIHNGFGLQEFKEDLTGPEYAQRYIEMVESAGIDIRLETMVLSLTDDKLITAVSPGTGLYNLKAESVVLAMGCRERTRNALGIPGTRPAGIMTAGTAQRFINIHGYMPGRKTVILGSGDVGMIMARRMTLEGARVEAVLELRPYLTGLLRNKIQCLDDFGIPLLLGHTITRICGRERLSAVTVAEVDERGIPVPGTEYDLECDTLLTSVGLIPENELSAVAGIELDEHTGGPAVDQFMQTSIPGIFASGNVLLVNDIVDDVSRQGKIAGANAARFVRSQEVSLESEIRVISGRNIHSVSPRILRLSQGIKPETVTFHVRVSEPETGVVLKVITGNQTLITKMLDWVGPGEMIKFKLDKNIQKKMMKSTELMVEVAENSKE